jgi:membrane protein implicated in regulation of membrane protease activity
MFRRGERRSSAQIGRFEHFRTERFAMIDGMNAELLWFLLGLIFLVAELAVPGFIIIFFGIGAWVTALCAGLGLLESFNAQLLVFLTSSALSLLVFRKKGKKYFEGKVSGVLEPGQDLDDIRGQKAIVVADITPKGMGGKVELHGTHWDAVADVPIVTGAVVEIVERTNLLLKVRPIE